MKSMVDAAHAYGLFLRASGKAASTLDKRDRAVKALLHYHMGDVADLNATHIYEALESFSGTEGTLNTYRQGMRSFAEYCFSQGWLPTLRCISGVRHAKYSPAPKQRVALDDFRDLLTGNVYERTQIAVGLYTLGRAGDISQIQIGEVDFQRSEISLYVSKTREWLKVPVLMALRPYLEEWYAHYESVCGKLQGDWYLLPARKTGCEASYRPEKPCEGRAIRRTVQAALERSGRATEGEGAHTLRRSGALAIYERLREDRSHGSAIKVVSTLLGHKSVTTTEIYLGVDADRAYAHEALTSLDLTPSAAHSHSGNVIAFPVARARNEVMQWKVS